MDALLHQYSIGGVVFGIGLYFAWKHGYIGLRGRGLINLSFMFGGIAIFLTIQGYLQYADMPERAAVPYEGDWERSKIIGQPVDYAIMIVYFLAILGIGTVFGRRQKTTKDFFMAGQRFSWWLVSLSLVATTVGSYSFVKYSRVAYDYGLSSSQSYFNDWFWIPLLIFSWLPILYFSRVMSIPEYFERRFGPRVRRAMTVLLLIYLVGYVGVNLFTMGRALESLLGWDVLPAAILVAGISAIYVTAGGQTSVIMTDLFQGVMLLATGAVIIVLGANYLDGFDALWEHLPRDHRTAFSGFNDDASFPAAGVFWQDGMANSAMFYLLNQGILMRFMAAKSVNEGRKAAMFMPVVLMPIAAIAVASGGWVGSALVHAGVLPADQIEAKDAFFITAEFLSQPGVFGLVMAALTAALMSTVDTLITAVAAIAVNDVYKPWVERGRRNIWGKPTADPKAPGEPELMRVARFSSVSVAVFGLLLVPVFMQFDSIYEAHGAFTAAITPPMVVALLCAVFWRRYTEAAAFWTLVGGAFAILLSILIPELVAPFSLGVPAADSGDGIFGGMKTYKFMRSLYGLVVSFSIAIGVTIFTKPESKERQRGLVWGTIKDALTHYKGKPGREMRLKPIIAELKIVEAGKLEVAHEYPGALLSKAAAALLEAEVGDLIYVCDKRRWLGGLRSIHAAVSGVEQDTGNSLWVGLSKEVQADLVPGSRLGKPVRVERMY